jgi:hypothetical protein
VYPKLGITSRRQLRQVTAGSSGAGGGVAGRRD